MITMFDTNRIPCNKNELVGLFFGSKQPKSEDDLYLDFYQFMEFALSKQADENFRKFMRKIKFNRSTENGEEPEKDLFLPMSFNLLLEYFNTKGKMRNEISKIEEEMEVFP